MPDELYQALKGLGHGKMITHFDGLSNQEQKQFLGKFKFCKLKS